MAEHSAGPSNLKHKEYDPVTETFMALTGSYPISIDLNDGTHSPLADVRCVGAAQLTSCAMAMRVR